MIIIYQHKHYHLELIYEQPTYNTKYLPIKVLIISSPS